MPPVVCTPAPKNTRSCAPRAAPIQLSATAEAVPDEGAPPANCVPKRAVRAVSTALTAGDSGVSAATPTTPVSAPALTSCAMADVAAAPRSPSAASTDALDCTVPASSSETPRTRDSSSSRPNMAARTADCGLRIAAIAKIADWTGNQSGRPIASAIESAIRNPQSPMSRSAMVRSLPSPVGVDLHLASDQRLRDRVDGLVRVKQRAVDPLEQQRELALVRRVDDEHAAARLGREAPIVEVIAVHGDQRPAQLLRQLIVFHVRRAAQIAVFE